MSSQSYTCGSRENTHYVVEVIKPTICYGHQVASSKDAEAMSGYDIFLC